MCALPLCIPIYPLTYLCARSCVALAFGDKKALAITSVSTPTAISRPGALPWAAFAGAECVKYAQCIDPAVLSPSYQPVSKSARPGTMTPSLAVPTSTIDNLVCSKCGTTRQSGKRSCCARGGAWFKKCGDVGDTHVDHTWAEGVIACKGKLWAAFCVIHCSVMFANYLAAYY